MSVEVQKRVFHDPSNLRKFQAAASMTCVQIRLDSLSPFTVIQNVAGQLAGTSRATVWTEIFPNTLAAQLGKPGAITAERVLFSR